MCYYIKYKIFNLLTSTNIIDSSDMNKHHKIDMLNSIIIDIKEAKYVT